MLHPQQSGGKTKRAFKEQFERGAFDSDLARADVVATWNHDRQLLLGRTQAGTLRLMPQADGIYVECDRANTSYANDLAELIARGDVSGMSFQFVTIADTVTRGESCDEIRIKQAHLREVSFVTNPCYDATEANSRDMKITSKMDPKRLELLKMLAGV